MILFIIAACLVAKIRGNRVLPALRERCFVPLWLVEIAFWIAQACAWCGNYSFIRWASVLQTAYLLALLPPIFRLRLYAEACIGSAMTVAGTCLNRWVISANGGRMPVWPTLSRLTGYYRDGAIEASADRVHMLMTEVTRLNILGDWIDVGFSVMSIGDILIHGFVFLVIWRGIEKWNRGNAA